MTNSAADIDAFEYTLSELETIVDRLERGELSLASQLADFERGIRLARGAQRALDDAERKVRILTVENAVAEPEPFLDP